MVYERVIDLAVMVLAEVLMVAGVFWSHRRLSVCVPWEAAWIVINHAFVIWLAYGILTFFATSFPGRFAWQETVAISGAIVLVCLILGLTIDALLARRERGTSPDDGIRGKKRTSVTK